MTEPMILNLNNRDVIYKSKKCHLSVQECAVFSLLAKRAHNSVSHQALARAIDPARVLALPENNVKVYICRLRVKLATLGLKGVIKSNWSAGYLLTHPIEMSEDDGSRLINKDAVRLMKRLIQRCEGTRQETLAHELQEAVF